MSRSLMSFGFCCDDGWYGILCDLMSHRKNDAIALAVARARERSLKTCELCGKLGSVKQDSRGSWKPLWGIRGKMNAIPG